MMEDPRLDPENTAYYGKPAKYQRVEDVPLELVEAWMEENIKLILNIHSDEIIDYANEHDQEDD